MAQHDYNLANQSGLAFRQDLNNALAAIVSQNSGATQPSTTYAYEWWADTTTGLLKIRNAANNAWITVGTLASANLGLLSLAGGTLTGALLADDAGTAALPAIAFDGDPNTGIFRAGADQLGIATNGVERVEFGTTEVVFNDGGADVDFRVEGDTNANLFKIDAGLDQVQVANLNGGPLAGTRNRIINGDMRFDQRNGGAAVTIGAATNTFVLDRWYGYGNSASKFSIQRNAGSVTPPAGFSNYLGVTSLSSYSVPAGEQYVIGHRIEGFNAAGFDFGTANAKTFSLSFWVRSSISGTHGGQIVNGAYNRSYPFSYTISAANTWEYKTVVVTGDTTGTWLSDNGIGLVVGFNLGSGSTFSSTANTWSAGNFSAPTGAVSVVGTNGATFYITGVQLELGTVATPFERRSYGQELALCQRYYQIGIVGLDVYETSGGNSRLTAPFRVSMRTPPTIAQTEAETIAFSTTMAADSIGINEFFAGRVKDGNTGKGTWRNFFTASAEL
jgi:hypothetical protein